MTWTACAKRRSAADGVIHLAFKHDAMQAGTWKARPNADLAAVEALAESLVGTDKPLVGTSGTLLLAMAGLTRAGTEEDTMPGGYPDRC